MSSIIGGYLFTKSLGSGAGGEVRLAERNGKQYAVKLLPIIQDNRKVDIQPFLREIVMIRTACSIIDSVKRIICAEEDELLYDQYYNYRPYGLISYTLASATLENKAEELAYVKKMYILHEIATSLDKLHQLGLAHGDIAMRNIMLDTGNQAYLIDFGRACVRAGSRAEFQARTLSGELITRYHSVARSVKAEASPKSIAFESAKQILDVTLVDLSCTQGIQSEERLPEQFHAQFLDEFSLAVANDTHMLGWTMLELLQGNMVFTNPEYQVTDAIRESVDTAPFPDKAKLTQVLTRVLGINTTQYIGRVLDIIAATSTTRVMQ